MDTNTSTGTSESPERGERYPLFELSRKVLLAGIGAISLAQDEAEEFVNRLVERGEMAEKDGRKLVQDMREKRSRTARKVEERMEKRVNEVLDRLNVPTKAEVEALNAKIAELSRKIDELNKAEKPDQSL